MLKKYAYVFYECSLGNIDKKALKQPFSPSLDLFFWVNLSWRKLSFFPFLSFCLGKSEVVDGAFNLHLLDFIYQFYSKKTILVQSIFWNPVGLFAFMSFTIISNYFDIVCYLKWEVSFAPISFEIQQNGIWTDTFNHLRYHFTCHLSCKYS